MAIEVPPVAYSDVRCPSSYQHSTVRDSACHPPRLVARRILHCQRPDGCVPRDVRPAVCAAQTSIRLTNPNGETKMRGAAAGETKMRGAAAISSAVATLSVRAGARRILWLAAAVLIATTAGCARMSVQDVKVETANVPKPTVILVHEFAVSPSQVALDTALGSRLERAFTEAPDAAQEIKDGREVAKVLAT